MSCFSRFECWCRPLDKSGVDLPLPKHQSRTPNFFKTILSLPGPTCAKFLHTIASPSSPTPGSSATSRPNTQTPLKIREAASGSAWLSVSSATPSSRTTVLGRTPPGLTWPRSWPTVRLSTLGDGPLLQFFVPFTNENILNSLRDLLSTS